jgi:signal transduction histidine kinase/FixJ family two-component response regulator/HPt (histidine-containing phosphotransfer) domain-containing protein
MKQICIFIKNRFLSRHLDFRVRLFNVLAIAGTIISTLMAISALITQAGIESFLLNLFTAGLSYSLLVYSYRTGKHQMCYLITIIVIFILMFTILFFTSGGYHSGMPSFFIFAVVFTVFMVEGKIALIMSVLEMILYIGICILAYYNPHTVIILQTERDVFIDNVASFAIVSVCLGTTMYIHFRMYNAQQCELEKAKEEALALSQIKTTFLANMSHEIRTPINVILGMNEMIMSESNITEISRYSKKIQNAGKTLLTLINNILDVSKIESGKLDIVKENYKIIELISDLIIIGQESATKYGLMFSVEVDEYLPSVLYGDFIHIKQVVINFLSNATKYTKEGSVILNFSQKNIDDHLLLCISVKDTGIGIDKNKVEYFFESFTRGDHPANTNIEGTGLGLAIVNELTELMNGKIYVDSVLEVGSTFIVEIPQGIEDNTPIGRIESEQGVERFEESSVIAPTGNILVIDDNRENLEVIKLLLKRTLLQIDTGLSGSECLKMVRNKPYDIIFMDYMMPYMNGIETLKKLRENRIETPVVALTANATVGAKKLFLTSGFSDYISKPIIWKELENVIIKLLPKEIIQLSDKDAKLNELATKNLREKLFNYDIFIEEGLKYVSGDLEQYKAIVAIFVEYFDESKAEIETLFMERDFDNLIYSVHSLKSKACSVGAMELSKLSAELEKRLRKGDRAYAEAVMPLIMFQWNRAITGFLEIV